MAESSAAPSISIALALDEDTPVVSAFGTAHDTFVEMLPNLLRRLAICEDADVSKTKRVAVRGELYDPSHIGVKFSAEFKEGVLTRVRVMTARGDEDLTQVPVELGGSGLMAPATGGAGILEADDTRAPPAKRKRAKAADDTFSLEATLARACELARIANRTELAAQLDVLLKSC